MELDEKELEGIIAGSGLSYEEAKKYNEKVVRKFKPAPKKEKEDLTELSEEDLEKYLGGIRIEDEEYRNIR